jgi:galactoside O-acetyltransferase
MTVYAALRWRLDRLACAMRRFDLRASGARVGRDVKVFGRFTWVGDPGNLQIGDRCTINEGVLFNARDALSIGCDVHLSAGVQLHTAGLDPMPGARRHLRAPIRIEDGVWIASGAIVTKGVTIGRNAIVGANAVVVRDVPPDTLVAGVPAEIVRTLERR